MLSDYEVRAALPAADLERAKSFYADKVGFTEFEQTEAGVLYECGDGTRFFLFLSSGAASGTHTQMSFHVKDIGAEVAELASRGVVFEEYDFPGLKTVDGVATLDIGKVAWFKDTEGNLIGVFQPAG